MAQPNVAREPSMEEILASIRRIIESNEPGQEIDFPADQSYSDDTSFESGSDLRSPPAHVPPPANQAFVQRQPVEAQNPAPNSVAQPEKSMSLADVAARVRAAADRNAQMAASNARAPEAKAPATAAYVAQPVQNIPFTPASTPQAFYNDQPQRAPRPTDVRPLMAQTPMAAREETVMLVEQQIEQPVEARSSHWDDVSIRNGASDESFVPVSAARKPEPQVRPTAIDIDDQVAGAEAFEQPSQDTGHSLSPLSANLLSELAEQEVARSFDELQNLFNVDDSPNVEEMTREMLRPMLKDWLDDNLPTIVERLVREEISRVVRGPKR